MYYLHDQLFMDYFKFQPDINENKRAILVNHLIDISIDLQLSHDTIHLGIILMDKYLATEKISQCDLLAVGIVCLCLATKMEEVLPISFKDYVDIIDNAYTVKYLINLEHIILEKINYSVYYDTIVQFLNIFYQQKKIKDETYYFSLYFSYALLTTIDYLFIDPEKLAHKITDFTLIMQSDFEQNTIESLINNDVLYRYIYLMWKKIDIISLTFIKQKIKNDYCFIVPPFNNKLNINFTKNLSNVLPRNANIWNEKYIKSNITQCNIYPDETIDTMITISELGSGTFGVVNHIKLLNENIALKIIFVDDNNIVNGAYYHFIREINTLQTLDHPNIIKLHGLYYTTKPELMCIGMELMQCTIYQKVQNTDLTEKIKGKYIMQLLAGLEYMHEQNIMHRDLSTNNILISSDDTLKIGDLGSSRYFHHDQYIKEFSTEICFLYFRPIELLLGKMPYTPMIDIWSCALVIGYILRGAYLISGDYESDIILKIFKILGTPTSTYNSELYNWLKFKKYGPFKIYPKTGFIYLGKKYPQQTKILYQMLEYDPSKRISAKSALQQFITIC